MKTKAHLDYLDLAKGIGILLVILGHGMFPNHFLIDSFHMPLFFILAGITFAPPIDLFWGNEAKNWLLKKIERIYVPYIFFMMVSAVFEIILGRVNTSSPFNAPLWFLQTIFVAIIMEYVLFFYLKSRYIILLCLLIGYSAYYVLQYTSISSVMPFNIYRSLLAMVFLHLGYIVANYYKGQSRGWSITIAIASAILFLSTLYISTINHNVFGLNFYTLNIFTYHSILPWILAISGSFTVLYASKLVATIKPLNWMGQNSLVIMCVHFPLIERLNVICASLPFYQTTVGKMGLAIAEYVVVITFSCAMVYVCKRYLPEFTGYRKTFLTTTS